jgi:hypothetical protein
MGIGQPTNVATGRRSGRRRSRCQSPGIGQPAKLCARHPTGSQMNKPGSLSGTSGMSTLLRLACRAGALAASSSTGTARRSPSSLTRFEGSLHARVGGRSSMPVYAMNRSRLTTSTPSQMPRTTRSEPKRAPPWGLPRGNFALKPSCPATWLTRLPGDCKTGCCLVARGTPRVLFPQ